MLRNQILTEIIKLRRNRRYLMQHIHASFILYGSSVGCGNLLAKL